VTDTIDWLLASEEPWARYRTLVDLLERPQQDAQVGTARAEMLSHPLVRGLIDQAAAWPGYALKRHNDARHAIYALSTLADFGLHVSDPGMTPAVEAVLAHQSEEGALQTPIRLYKRFGGIDGEWWTWMGCDAPTLLYALLAFGLRKDDRVRRAVDHLVGLAEENGWRCTTSRDLGSFKGPGRREDPCPVANVYALKALSLEPDLVRSTAAQAGTNMLLWHWEHRAERKLFLFGVGTDFRKLKYPFVWYDILHVTDVLSRFPFVLTDPRFQEMVIGITDQADGEGRYTATSMYRAWTDWSFANKKTPSPWLTFIVLRILRRMRMAA